MRASGAASGAKRSTTSSGDFWNTPKERGESFEIEAWRRRARLGEDFEATHLIEAEQDRGGANLHPADEIGARAEEDAVGHDLSPARRISIVELDHAPREQRLAQVSENGRVGERARADAAGEGFRRKLSLDVDGKPPPVDFAQGRADLGSQRTQERRTAGLA